MLMSPRFLTIELDANARHHLRLVSRTAAALKAGIKELDVHGVESRLYHRIKRVHDMFKAPTAIIGFDGLYIF